MFLERSSKLPVCTKLSDTKPLTYFQFSFLFAIVKYNINYNNNNTLGRQSKKQYRVWDMLVDLNLYVQTINQGHMSFLVSTDLCGTG